MAKYILKRGDEIVEVMEGREERRDKLIAAGYEWVNRPNEHTKPKPRNLKPYEDKGKGGKGESKQEAE